ncbi:putative MarR family transcriptional regulator [Gordonia hirsuta DSM 44140 = NBRC 16056]|uniref:Putative MarR family transcriptional regulator n=1 Tax=Gordonia hirsuta DSM 44140 = NBRC 16056 TaxID=1121927 RepID=L7L8X1_9ACTN|nr:MarR family transcriptional regulator [Gordonia hirsuta]GAC57211.1 putative MarR family transcriptional regulator [Gordonia hirsuta DSM 44140 = NBRC 16056]
MSDTPADEATVTISATCPISLLKSLLLTGHRLQIAVTAAGVAHGLTADEWLILDALTTHDGLAMSQVSALTLSSGASLTRAVDRLVTRSLLYRTPSLTDRRKVEVHLSDLGRELHGQMTAELAEINHDLHACLAGGSVDPEAAAAMLSGGTGPH